MLAMLRCNSDVQLPYRFAIAELTHCSTDAQMSQDAQVGYACDYQNKRQSLACNEVKECCE